MNAHTWFKFPAGYFSDVRLIRLRRELGSTADTLPIRLWDFAARNAPSGNLAEYQPQELAELLAWSGAADVMVRALENAGYMKAGAIMDWDWHFALTAARREAAKKGAEGLWRKRRDQSSPTPPQTEEIEERRGDSHALRDAMRDASTIPFPWERVDQLPDQLRAELASAYHDATDQQNVLDVIRGNELRFNARHVAANWPAIVLAAIQREAKADDARTGRTGRRAGFADASPRTRQRATPQSHVVSLAEPTGDWRATALSVANDTPDQDLRERRVEAIEDRASWGSLSEEFRAAIIARHGATEDAA